MRRLVLLLALLALALPAAAIEPDRREVIAIKAQVWDGFRYAETFLPSTADRLTLLSGQDSAIAFIRTEEYYWPLSRQVYLDLDRRQEPVEGLLRIERDGQVVAERAPEPYAILYPDGAANGQGSLLWGDEALAAFAAYEQSERDFNRAFVQAQQAQARYQDELLKAGARQNAGGPQETVPPPPPLPEPSLRLVTRPALALRVGLDPGDYRISLMQEGRPVPGTARDLRVIDAAGRQTLVADVIPEERWTRPLAANSSAARIFARPGTTFYLTLSEATRFDETEYLPVVSPQAPAVAGRPMWVRRKPATQDSLLLVAAGGETPLSFDRLKVEQTQGSAFGYRVRPAAETETPDLSAFAVTLPASGRLTLALPDGTTLNEIVVVPPRRASLGLVLALLPLLAGAVLLIRRRRAALAA